MTPQFPTPFQLIQLSIQTSVMLAEAQMVMAMRMMGMFGLWRVTPSEQTRMVAEKMTAVGQSATAASLAILAGKPAVQVAGAALKPVRRKTASNVKRLARRGLGKP